MNKLHAIWMLCACLLLPSMAIAAPTIQSFTVNGFDLANPDQTPPYETNRNIEMILVANPSKATGAGSVITKVEFYVDGLLKSTVTVPKSVTLPAPRTYTFSSRFTLTAGSHTFKAIAYENTAPVSSKSSDIMTVQVIDAAPDIISVTCTPDAINYVANPTVSISATANVKDDIKVTKVEFYWVVDPEFTESLPGTLKNTILVNKPVGTATYLYTGINASGELRILAYDELGNQPTEIRKKVSVVPNEAPNCGPELTFTDPETAEVSTFTSPVVKNGLTEVAGNLFNPGVITIQIAAEDKTGTVTKMELFNNNVLLATSTKVTAIPNANFTKPPYFLFTFTFPAMAAGTYKLSWKATDSYGAFCVSDLANPYILTVSKCEDANEPANNLRSGAATLAIPSVKYAKIASVTDVDWYKITLTDGVPVSLTLSGTNSAGEAANLPVDFDLVVYKSSGKGSTIPVKVGDNEGTEPENVNLSELAAGTYFIKVYGYGDAGATPPIPNAFSASCYRLEAIEGGGVARRVLGKSTKKPMPTEAAPVSMLLMPNPAANEVSLLTTVENAGEYQVSITDFLGRELKRQTLTLNEGDNVSTLDIAAIGKGMYMVRLWSENQQIVQKLSVEK